MLICAGSYLWRLSRATPGWYRPPNASDPQVAAFSEEVEFKLVQHVQEIRPAEEAWALRIREEQVNAWLAARLPQWLANDPTLVWPEELRTPQVRITSGGISLAVPVVRGDTTRFVTATFEPQVQQDERMLVNLDSVSLGQLMLPGDPATYAADLMARVLAAVRTNPDPRMAETARQVLQAVMDREPVEPEFKLADGRRVRVKNVVFGEGFVDVTAVTLPAERRRKAARE